MGRIRSQGNPALVCSTTVGGAGTTERASMSQYTFTDKVNQNNSQITIDKKRNISRLTVAKAREWKKQGRLRRSSPATTSPIREQIDINIACTIDREEALEQAQWEVPQLGKMTTNRPGNVFRIMSGQLYGMSSRGVHNRQLCQIESMLNK